MSLWFQEKHHKHVRLGIRVTKQLCQRQTEFQDLAIYQSPCFGKILVLDDCLMLTEKDEFIYHEMLVHPAMAVAPQTQEVLVIGGGDGGVVRELCRYPGLVRIDLVEIDAEVTRLCRKYFPKLTASLNDPRVTITHEDGLKFVRNCKAAYDLIIVDSTDPFGPGEGLFTREFYGNCYKALRPQGILVNQHESPYYKKDAAMVRATHQRTKAVFPGNWLYQAHVPTYPSGHWLFGFLTKGLDPLKDQQSEAWEALELPCRYYNSRLHQGAFALPSYVLDLLKGKDDEKTGRLMK